MNFFLKRPILAIVINIFIAILGLIALKNIEVRDRPNISIPVISVEAYLDGADAEFMDISVASLLEENMRSISGLENIKTESGNGYSNIKLTFKINTNLDSALDNTKSKVLSAMQKMPSNMKMPKVSKMDFADHPSIWIAAYSDKLNIQEISDIIKDDIIPDIEKLNLVGGVVISGAKYTNLFIEPDPHKMYIYKISPMQIRSAIKKYIQDTPLGIAYGKEINYVIKLNDQQKDIEYFNKIPVAFADDKQIMLHNIAKVYFGPYNDHYQSFYNSKDAIGIGIKQKSCTNILEFADEVKNAIKHLKYPKDLHLEIAYDGSVPIHSALNNVIKSIIESIVFVVIVIYLFLGNIRITLINLITIPLSLLGAIILMKLCGFSINTFSLMGMILSTGLVVDDPIVIIEDIYKNFKSGMSHIKAAEKSGSELFLVILAMTSSTAAVFIPIGLIEGFVGQLFIEFAWSLSFAVLCSGVVSITLVPLATRYAMQFNNIYPPFIVYIQKNIVRITALYKTSLTWFIESKRAFIIVSFTTAAGIFIGFKYSNKMLSPAEDLGFFLMDNVAQTGSSTEQTAKEIRKAEDILRENKYVKKYFSWAMGSYGFTFVSLVDYKHRELKEAQIRQNLKDIFDNKVGINIYSFSPDEMMNSTPGMIEFMLQTRGNIEQLTNLQDKIVNALSESNNFEYAFGNIKASAPTVSFYIDNNIAYNYGVDIEEIKYNIRSILTPDNILTFTKGSKEYNCYLGSNKDNEDILNSIKAIYVKTQKGSMLPLSSFINQQYKSSILQYFRYNNYRISTIQAKIKDGVNTNEAVEKINDIFNSYKEKKSDILIKFSGSEEKMKETFLSMIWVSSLAIIFLYLVLSVQFNSFILPIFILFAVPFSISGGLLSIFITGCSINAYTGIGLITLIGLITKNSIMIVEVIKTNKEKIQEYKEAVMIAAAARLRPILMTTFTTIIGATPVLFASGSNAQALLSIAVVIIGGIAIGSLFTIFAIPFICCYIKI